MAQATSTQHVPLSQGTATAMSATLATAKTSTGRTDSADVIGYVSRVYIHVDNGATNSVVWGVDGSHDGTNWFELAFRRETGTYATTDRTTTSAVKEAVFLSGPDTPRFVCVNVTTANANGSTFVLHAEK
jgi:hypothetical protein